MLARGRGGVNGRHQPQSEKASGRFGDYLDALGGEELKQWVAEGYLIAGYSLRFGGNTFLMNRYPDGRSRIDWRSGAETGGTWTSEAVSVENDTLCSSWNNGPKRCGYVYRVDATTFYSVNANGNPTAIWYKLQPYEEFKKLAVAPEFTTALLSLDERLEKLKDYMRIARPVGDGPFPVVVQAPGCSGFVRGRGMYNPAQEKLVEMGYVVVRADYFKARGESVCDGGAVSADEAAADIKLVVEHVRTLPYADPADVTIMGWSFGGSATLQALASGADIGVRRFVAFYPGCNSTRSWKASVPGVILSGDADTITPVSACLSLFDGSETVSVKVYPSAYHAFDNIFLPPKRESRHGGLSGHNPEATEAAWAEIEKFLAQ